MTPSVGTLRRRRAIAEKAAPRSPGPPARRPPVPKDPDERAALTERLLTAFELQETGIFDWDVASGGVRYFLPGQPTIGLDPGVLRTSADEWFDTAHPDDLALASAAVDRALRGETEKFTSYYRRRHGEDWRYVQTEGKVIARGADGRALRVIGIYRDVTEPVAQEKGRHARETSARHAQVRASLTEFATSLAHELNQPLAALSTNVQAALRLLEDGRAKSAEVRQALVRSVALAERAADVVRAMRQIVRPEGRTEERFDLRALARDVCDLVAPEARRADVVLRVSPSSAPAFVSADRGQIELVVLNLVRNAIEAIAGAASARRLVTVRVRRLSATARLEVEDTGPGVDPRLGDRIFEAYFTTKAAGTGLGLRLCRSFAEAHGGRISCAPPRPRRGARFSLELPAVSGEAGVGRRRVTAGGRARRG